MNTTELVYMMCDGRTSLNDIMHLLLACGHTREAWHEALDAILDDENMVIEFNSNREPYIVQSQ